MERLVWRCPRCEGHPEMAYALNTDLECYVCVECGWRVYPSLDGWRAAVDEASVSLYEALLSIRRVIERVMQR